MKWARAGWVGLLSVFLSAATAFAGPPPAPQSPDPTHLETRVEQAPSDGATSTPIDFDLGLPPLRLPQLLDEEQSLSIEMPAPRAEGLDLRFRLHPTMTFYVSADLSGSLPRLDALDGESYWAPGLEFHVTPALSLFVEDFQPTSAITGGDEDAKDIERAPSRSWDGHQVALGVRYLLGDAVELRGQLVGYTLSISDRSDALGGMVSVRWTF